MWFRWTEQKKYSRKDKRSRSSSMQVAINLSPFYEVIESTLFVLHFISIRNGIFGEKVKMR
jgi:hypothetical protein